MGKSGGGNVWEWVCDGEVGMCGSGEEWRWEHGAEEVGA